MRLDFRSSYLLGSDFFYGGLAGLAEESKVENTSSRGVLFYEREGMFPKPILVNDGVSRRILDQSSSLRSCQRRGGWHGWSRMWGEWGNVAKQM